MKLISKIKKRLIRLFPKKSVAKHNGAWFLLDPLNWIDNRILAGLGYEENLIKYMLQAMQQYNLTTMLDIGANIGYYSVLARTHNTNLQDVYAFEPVRRNLYQMHANLYLNGQQHSVNTYPLALSNARSTVAIYIDPRSTGVSRLSLQGARRDTAVFKEQEIINTAPLDELLHHTGQRVFVKIDTEGHEVQVLQGMQTYLRNNSCLLQIEIAPENEASVATLMHAAGYKLLGNSKDNFYYGNTT